MSEPVLEFRDAGELWAWLEDNSTTHPGGWVRLARARSRLRTVSFEELLEAGIAFGWSESTRRGLDHESYLQRFTPRRRPGTTSARNRRIAERLVAEGRMRPGGLHALGGGRFAAALPAAVPASHAAFLAERPPGADEDVHMLADVVDQVIGRFSAPGDLVLDPFAGFGTTLQRATALGRQALGIELLPERVEHIRRRTPAARVLEGDARGLRQLLARAFPDGVPRVDLVLTSPPYMTATHHDADPLTAYEESGASYDRYLDELQLVAAQCAQVVRPGGVVVWNVADIRHRDTTTHLITDCEQVLSTCLTRVAVVPIEWDELPHDLVADALLVFQRPA